MPPGRRLSLKIPRPGCRENAAGSDYPVKARMTRAKMTKLKEQKHEVHFDDGRHESGR
jgi:hypothetical protein